MLERDGPKVVMFKYVIFMKLLTLMEEKQTFPMDPIILMTSRVWVQAKDFALIFWQDGLLVKLILLFTVTIIYWIQKSQTLLSKELARNSVVVFEQAHNIDNTCIDSMSVKINRKLLDKCQNSITVLEEEIQRLKSADSERLKDEYDRLVAGLRQAQENRDNAVVLANPVLPDHVLQEAVPGNIRKGEHFVAFIKR